MTAAVSGNHAAASPSTALAVSRVASDCTDLSKRVDVLCRAFDQDAHINWLIRQDARRKSAMAALFRLLLTEMGGELHATADGESVALWFPPGAAPSWNAQSRFFLGLLNIAGPLRAIRRGIDLKRMDQQHPAEPHFYLQLLGVNPACQRQGHGSALLARLFEQARESNCPVYLETSNPRNEDFYTCHGFVRHAETTLSDGLRLWSLLWQPPGRA